MVAGSILPICLHNGKLCFLFGKENPMENSANGFSDFGGRVEKNETIFAAALREGAEELTGFLGSKNQLKKLIQKQGPTLNHVHNKYHVHMFHYPYNEDLVKFYNNNHAFLWNAMDKDVLNKSKLFEKIDIQWFHEDELMSKLTMFRPFYREIVMQLYDRKSEIRDYLQKTQKQNTTRKKRV